VFVAFRVARDVKLGESRALLKEGTIGGSRAGYFQRAILEGGPGKEEYLQMVQVCIANNNLQKKAKILVRNSF